MSIKPQYAEAILSGTKRIEFRKRKLADDISAVVVYSTLPVGQIVGVFSVLTCEIASPTALWQKHHHHAGIARTAYRDYYRGNRTAVGILINQALALDAPVPLPEAWPTVRPPQSLTYLSPAPSLAEPITRLFPLPLGALSAHASAGSTASAEGTESSATPSRLFVAPGFNRMERMNP